MQNHFTGLLQHNGIHRKNCWFYDNIKAHCPLTPEWEHDTIFWVKLRLYLSLLFSNSSNVKAQITSGLWHKSTNCAISPLLQSRSGKLSNTSLHYLQASVQKIRRGTISTHNCPGLGPITPPSPANPESNHWATLAVQLVTTLIENPLYLPQLACQYDLPRPILWIFPLIMDI